MVFLHNASHDLPLKTSCEEESSSAQQLLLGSSWYRESELIPQHVVLGSVKDLAMARATSANAELNDAWVCRMLEEEGCHPFGDHIITSLLFRRMEFQPHSGGGDSCFYLMDLFLEGSKPLHIPCDETYIIYI